MSSKSVFSCSAVSHVSAIFAYIPNKPEVDVQKKKGNDNMVKYLFVALNAFIHYFANL
jgi:hypothetical protein